MNKADNTTPIRFLVAAAAATLTFGVTSTALATTDTTEPGDATTAGTEMDHSEMSMPAGADGSAEPTSPEAAAFCEAELAAEAAFGSQDPALIGPAIEALVAAAPADVAPAVEELIANAEAQGPAFEEPYGAVLDYMRANCGYAELNIAASDYAFGGLAPELPAGPTIVAMENIGQEVHEVVFLRINDDVTLAVEELLALPEEEGETMTTFAGIAFAFPGAVGQTVVDLTPGRYVAICFLPEGALPEVMEQMDGPESSTPPGVELGPPHFVLGMVHEFQAI